MDLNVPSAPRIIGQEILPGRAWDVVVQGDFAYLSEGTALNDGGMHVVDITNRKPQAPGKHRLNGRCLRNRRAREIIATWPIFGTLFTSSTSKTRTQPTIACQINVSTSDVFVDGDVLYAAIGRRLRVIDISLTAHSKCHRRHSDDRLPRGIVTDHHAVYVSDGGSGLAASSRNNANPPPGLQEAPSIAGTPFGLRCFPNPGWDQVRIDMNFGSGAGNSEPSYSSCLRCPGSRATEVCRCRDQGTLFGWARRDWR